MEVVYRFEGFFTKTLEKTYIEQMVKDGVDFGDEDSIYAWLDENGFEDEIRDFYFVNSQYNALDIDIEDVYIDDVWIGTEDKELVDEIQQKVNEVEEE